MIFWVLRNLLWLSIIGLVVFMFATGVAFDRKKIGAGYASLIMTFACSVSIFSSIGYISPDVVSYTSVLPSKPISVLKEDMESGRVIWKQGGKLFARDAKDCQIVVVDQELASDASGESDFTDLPRLQLTRMVSYEVIEAFDQVFHSEPIVWDVYRFYVPKSYLDSSKYDWDLLDEIKG